MAAIAAAVEACNQLTTRPADPAVTDYQNAVSQVIVDCLRDSGCTITTNGDELTDGGRLAISWTTVPTDVTYSQAYTDDLNSCTSYAESQVPNPNPCN